MWSHGHNAKTHRGTATLFKTELVDAGLVEPDYHKILTRGLQHREAADYDLANFDLDKSAVKTLVADSQRFYERMSELLATKTGGDTGCHRHVHPSRMGY